MVDRLSERPWAATTIMKKKCSANFIIISYRIQKMLILTGTSSFQKLLKYIIFKSVSYLVIACKA
jgi:hypothetical protein